MEILREHVGEVEGLVEIAIEACNATSKKEVSSVAAEAAQGVRVEPSFWTVWMDRFPGWLRGLIGKRPTPEEIRTWGDQRGVELSESCFQSLNDRLRETLVLHCAMSAVAVFDAIERSLETVVATSAYADGRRLARA